MKIAICDDNRDELLHIASILDTYMKERNAPISYYTCHSATELLSTLKCGSYDLYLLDVIMPAVSGMEAAKEIRSFDKVAKIAFLTSSPEFAIESYSEKACHYLLKPVTKEKLFFALDDVMETVDRENEATIVVKSSEGMQRILLSQLTYVEALDRRVIYHLENGNVVESIYPFTEVCEELLNYSAFIKPHRSYVVNMSYINTIKNTEIILQTGGSLPIAQRRVSEIKEGYLAYQMEGE